MRVIRKHYIYTMYILTKKANKCGYIGGGGLHFVDVEK